MAILTEHEAGLWAGVLTDREYLRARVAALEEALIVERATAMYLRDRVEMHKANGQVWPTREEVAADLPFARLELQREGLLPQS